MVIGAGFAGEEHTRALQWCGVEVVAICARQAEVVRAVAARLGVGEAATDWRETLRRERPDIVALATPASLRGEVIAAAAALGAHVYSDKPLAADAVAAQRLYRLVEQAGVKHALAATHRYDPSVAWLAELLREGAIGALVDVEYSLRLHLPPGRIMPWSWFSTVATGGGFAGQFPHILGILGRITGADVRRVAGVARRGEGPGRAPVVPGMHDFREIFTKAPTAEEAARLEWREVDVETTCAALLCFGPLDASGREVTVSLTASYETPAPWPPHGMRLHGTEGTLIAEGYGEYAVSRLRNPKAEREQLPVPQRLVDDVPRVGTPVQNKWAALAREFVADIRGEPHQPYPTFYDGWRSQEVFDAVRAGRGWTDIPA